MKLNCLLLLSAARATVAQTLQDILTAQSATLSTLNAWLATQSLVFQILSNAQGVTLLAPSNNAFSKIYSTPLYGQLAADPNLLTAFLSYHVLDGVYSASDFADPQSAFVPTFLNMEGYTNVSGGQVIESRSQNGTVTLISGNRARSNFETYVRLPTEPCSPHIPACPLFYSDPEEKMLTEKTLPGLQLHRRYPAHHRHGADHPGKPDGHAPREQPNGGCRRDPSRGGRGAAQPGLGLDRLRAQQRGLQRHRQPGQQHDARGADHRAELPRHPGQGAIQSAPDPGERADGRGRECEPAGREGRAVCQ